MLVERIYDEDLAQACWLIGCQATREALIIDPERDVCRYIEVARNAGFKIVAVAETHIHADFLSGSHELAIATGATVYLSNHGGEDWSYVWPKNSSAKVKSVVDGDSFNIGNITITVVHTPGHTPEHICFLVSDSNGKEPMGLISGDFVFVGDLGRPDLLETAAGIEGVMEASAAELYTSCLRFCKMEEYMQVWPGHGAGSACGKALGAVPQSTVGYEKRTSPPLQHIDNETDFIDFMLTEQPEPPLYFARMKRMNRDGVPLLRGLPAPRRITSPSELASLALNATVIDTRPWNEVRDGHLPNSIWSPANAAFHRFAGSFVSDEENIILIVSEDSLDRALRNAIRIGLDKIIAWTDASVVQEVTDLQTMPEIHAKELDARKDAVVLDVRKESEFSRGAIEGAMHIAHTRVLDHLSELDSSKQLIVNCQGGSRSAAACMALRRNGFDVINLAGGYSGWKQFKDSCAVTQ
jgi:hydroxyacylglutathione hydrolase